MFIYFILIFYLKFIKLNFYILYLLFFYLLIYIFKNINCLELIDDWKWLTASSLINATYWLRWEKISAVLGYAYYILIFIYINLFI